MLAAVIKARERNSVLEDAKKARAADIIELRADYLSSFDFKLITEIKRNLKKPVLVTCRNKNEGGIFNGSEAERMVVLKTSIDNGADYVDIEFSSGNKNVDYIIKNKKDAKVIVSYHNFKETPKNIRRVYENIKKTNPDLIKIVSNANSVIDNFKIFDLIRVADNEKIKIIAFCMGSYGKFSRILSVILGSKATYASVGKGKETASGQPSLYELCSFYRIKKINGRTKIAGLIGNPVEHSWSNIIHNFGFDYLNLDAVYLKFRVDKLKEFIEYFKKLEILGFSVTIPHKIEVIKYLDSIDKKAKAIGAVNTIVCKNGKWIGYNTDRDGAIMALKEKMQLKSRKIVVIGAGGSARAITYGLKEEMADVWILNRTMEKAKTLANNFDCDYGSLSKLKEIDYDILINTTPVGMYPYPNRKIVPNNLIRKNTVVFDIVFNPYKTKLLQDAENKGCIVIPGFEMLMNGAALQFELWTGKKAPKQAMRKNVMENLKNAAY